MKNYFISSIAMLVVFISFSFITINSENTLNNEKEAVENVLKSYRGAIQNLTVDNTDQLFTKDSQIFESGGSEGSYQNYKEHHLGPELEYFKSFTFNDYIAEIKIDLPYAFVTETYVYEIVIEANKEKGRNERVITKKGVATIILKKVDGNWKIAKYHSSSREKI